jgi:cysteine desulfurase/selenocysteine lyase
MERRMATNPPYQGGGEMIKRVSLKNNLCRTTNINLEAGTPNIAGGIVLGTAVDYMELSRF